jgi:hypothetical protein
MNRETNYTRCLIIGLCISLAASMLCIAGNIASENAWITRSACEAVHIVSFVFMGFGSLAAIIGGIGPASARPQATSKKKPLPLCGELLPPIRKGNRCVIPHCRRTKGHSGDHFCPSSGIAWRGADQPTEDPDKQPPYSDRWN